MGIDCSCSQQYEQVPDEALDGEAPTTTRRSSTNVVNAQHAEHEPEPIRQGTLYGLREKDIPNWYLAGQFTSSTFQAFRRFFDGHLKTQMNQNSAGRYARRTALALVAGCANADGDFHPWERQLFESIAEAQGISAVETEELAATQHHQVPALLTKFKKATAEFMQSTNSPTVDADSLLMPILFTAVAVCAADGLVREEMAVMNTIADVLGLDPECPRRVVECIRLEQEIFRRYHAVFRQTQDGDTDVPEDADIAGTEAEITEVVEEFPGLACLTTIDGLERADVPPWYLESDLIGSTLDIWLSRLGVLSDEQMTIIHKECAQESGSMDILFRLVAACARGDGDLSEIERLKFMKFAGKLGYNAAPVEEWMRTPSNQVQQLSDALSGVLENHSQAMKEKMGAMNTFKRILNDPQLLFDGSTWGGPSRFETNLRRLCVMIVVVVAASDGLERLEVDELYRLTEAIKISREDVRRMTHILALEQELYRKYHALLAPGMHSAGDQIDDLDG